jgi:hypothetical protein
MTLVKVAVSKGTVYLAPKLTVPMGAAAMAVINMAPAGIGPIQAAITGSLFAPAPAGSIVAWEGSRFEHKIDGIVQPEELTAEAIERLLPWIDGGSAIAEKIEELYSEDLFRPLAERRSKASPPGQTAVSTSAEQSATPDSPSSGSRRPKSSKRSSPNGSAGMRSVVPVR